jgi:hypothetical protein
MGSSDVYTVMTSALREPLCICATGSTAPKDRSADCPVHGNPYKPNPSLVANAWVQPYVPRQS